MSSDALEAISWYLQSGWYFLTGFNLPGTNFTPAAALFAVAFFSLLMKFIRSLIGRLSPGRGGVPAPPSNLPAVRK